jgi:hypothetical protein
MKKFALVRDILAFHREVAESLPLPVAGVFSSALVLEFTLTTLFRHVDQRAPDNDGAPEPNLWEGIDEVDHIQEC